MERAEKLKQEWDVTVILSIFKRPYNLGEQIEAIENQTIKPKEIIIINNGCLSQTPQRVKDKYTVIENNVNFGVWFRFSVALNCTTKYINIIDDDTIPWKKRLENCLECSKKQRWLYWTIGCIFGIKKPMRAKDRWETRAGYLEHYYSHTRFWRANPNKDIQEVDLIWHSRFFEREFLSKAYFKEPMPDSPYCWEDMRFTYTLQKYMWLWSYVPPHPPNDLEMRWSKKGWELWTKDWSWDAHWWGDNDIYDKFYQQLRKNGFKCLLD